MNEVLLTNVFFIITGTAVIICTALLSIVLVYAIKAMRALRRILTTIEAGTEVIAEDLEQIRSFFAQDGFIMRLITMAMGRGGRRAVPRSKVTKKQAELAVTDN